VLLSRSELVEPASYVSEPAVHPTSEIAYVMLQPVETMVQPVETSGRLHAERVDGGAIRVDLDAEVRDVAVPRGRQVPSRGGVGGNLFHADLQRGNACLEFGLFRHDWQRTGAIRQCRQPSVTSASRGHDGLGWAVMTVAACRRPAR
jgi:hypothetical protein